VPLLTLLLLVILVVRRPRDPVVPAFLLGAGVCGFALSAWVQASGYSGSFAVGVSGSYTQPCSVSSCSHGRTMLGQGRRRELFRQPEIGPGVPPTLALPSRSPGRDL